MKIYLVGGAVRDQLLGLPVKEKDWVVVGASIAEMLRQGFRQVGKDFPVFLHPETHEEYALARLERKIGHGYSGFSFDASPHVTLEEDLLRRDLTINAIAEAPGGALIDPYQGKADVEKRVLRHVSPAFVEDPVRILRVARFAARFVYLGFTVATETMSFMKQMVASGEINALVAERVWKELEYALSEKNPEEFFQVLTDCNALSVLFPQINLANPGINALKQAVRTSPSVIVRFAVLMHALSSTEIDDFSVHYRVPNDYRELAILVARYASSYQAARYLSAEELLSTLQALDAFRRETRFQQFLTACAALATHQNDVLWQAYLCAKAVDTKEFATSELKGQAIAAAIYQKRLAAIKAVTFSFSDSLGKLS